MTALRAIVRTLSDSAGFADPATDEHGLVELTDEQLDQVAGGGCCVGRVVNSETIGPKPGVATDGGLAPRAMPYGSKIGTTGSGDGDAS
jgi:hypothetical protein